MGQFFLFYWLDLLDVYWIAIFTLNLIGFNFFYQITWLDSLNISLNSIRRST